MMKTLVCLMVAVLMVTCSACGNNDTNKDKDTQNGVIEDSNGVIDESGDDNLMDDAADGANDVVDGATDVVDDAAKGVRNAVDDMTDGNQKNR